MGWTVTTRTRASGIAAFAALLLIAVGFVEPMMFVIGPLFAISWWYALRAGSRIDRENRERDAEQAAWEESHPDQAGPAAGEPV